MQNVTFVIAVVGFVLSIYTFIVTRLGRRPRLEIFRFAPEGLVVDDDFDTLHVYTDADFIVTNLSDKPNTVIRLEAAANIGDGWLDGTVYGKRLSERMRTRTDYGGAGGEPSHHNEIVHEWVGADVCPIMLSPQASGIPNQGVSLRMDFQSMGPINDLESIRLRLTLHDQYGKNHRFDLDARAFSSLKARRFPKFFDDEHEIGRLKDRILDEDMEAVVRVVHRRYEENLSQSTLSVRRYYPLKGGRRVANVAHRGRDGYAYDTYRPRDFQKGLAQKTDAPFELGSPDGFRISFTAKDGLPQVLHLGLPIGWSKKEMDVPIPEDFSRLCAVEEPA